MVIYIAFIGLLHDINETFGFYDCAYADINILISLSEIFQYSVHSGYCK